MTLSRTLGAYSVHVFTATGVIFGFLALMATVEKQPFLAFMYLGIALLIDGIDGTLARAVGVKSVTPNVDGTTLDNVIDFFTYAIIPAAMIWCWDLVPMGWGAGMGAGVLLASCATYANSNMKTRDGYFVGFPAIWNLVVLYLLIFGIGQHASLLILLICMGLTFVPSTYVHPFRVRFLMPLTVFMTLLWTLSVSALSWTVLLNDQSVLAQPWWGGILILTSLYFAAISLRRSFMTPRRI